MKSSQMFKVVFGVFLLFLTNSCATTPTLVQSPQPDTTAQDVKVSIIQRISYIEEGNYTRILIEGSETIAPPFYKLLSDPLRVAIDVPHIDLKQIKEPVRIDNGTVGEVFVTQYDDKGRIEIGLLQMTNYNISKEEKNLIIDIEKVKKVAETKETKKEEETIKETIAEAPAVEPKKEEPPPPPTVVNKAKEVVNVLFEEKSDFITFNIVADGRLENYNSFKLDSPARLVLDIWGVGSRYPKKSLKMKNPFVKEVRIGQHLDKLRLVFDSTKSKLPPYQINRIDDKLIVSVGNVPQPSEPQILLQEKATERVTPPKVKGVQALSPKAQEQTPPTSEGPAKTVKANTLTEIDFKQMDHKSRIIVALTGEPKFESHTISKRMIAVDIKNASVPKHLQRRLDTSEFESAVNYINVQNVKAGKANDVRILIELREEVPFETAKEGKLLFIDIEKPKKIEAKIETVPMPRKEGVTIETKKEETQREEEKAPPELKKEEKALPAVEEKPIPKSQVTKKVEEEKKASEERLPEKIYTKPKLSLDFKDADVKNILRLIAEVSNLNIITGDDVTGKITMRLVEVPWDQALDVILQVRSLGKRQVGNVIYVAPLDTMIKQDQTARQADRDKERSEELKPDLIPVNYASAEEISSQVKSILSERGDVKVDKRTNTLIIKDIPSRIENARSLVKSLDTKTPQVLIEARIIEANLTFQEELGVSWGFLTSTGTGQNKTFTVGGGRPGSTLGTATNKVVDLPAQPKVGTAGLLEFLFTSKYGLKELDFAISAHENQGNVKIISSPKIATLDNKQASIEQGLRIPVRKIDPSSGQISTDFIEANIKLTVTPHVTNDGNIKLNITAKKDAPDFSQSVDNVPSIDKKEAITEVLIKDNGVFVIAGIYTIEKAEGVEGVPLFSKIPLLGWLFKRQAKEEKRKDLMIFISPKIVKDQT